MAVCPCAAEDPPRTRSLASALTHAPPISPAPPAMTRRNPGAMQRNVKCPTHPPPPSQSDSKRNYSVPCCDLSVAVCVCRAISSLAFYVSGALDAAAMRHAANPNAMLANSHKTVQEVLEDLSEMSLSVFAPASVVSRMFGCTGFLVGLVVVFIFIRLGWLLFFPLIAKASQTAGSRGRSRATGREGRTRGMWGASDAHHRCASILRTHRAVIFNRSRTRVVGISLYFSSSAMGRILANQ